MGFFSFLIKDKKSTIVNVGYLCVLLLFFGYITYGVFELNLLKGKVYYSVMGGWSKAMGIELKYNLNTALTILFLLSS